MNTHKAITIGLAVACVVLAVVSGVLAFLLSQRTRFVSATDKSPFIMFDRGTAQACWSGSAYESIVEQKPLSSSGTPKADENPLNEIFPPNRLGTPKADESLLGDLFPPKGQPKRDSRGRPINNPPEIPFCKDLK